VFLLVCNYVYSQLAANLIKSFLKCGNMIIFPFILQCSIEAFPASVGTLGSQTFEYRYQLIRDSSALVAKISQNCKVFLLAVCEDSSGDGF
jgi:hypothetical protein